MSTPQEITYTIEGEAGKMAFTTARINAAIDTALADTTHVQLHTGAPGAAGTSNVASGVSRASLTKGSATNKQATCTASWIIPSAGGPYTHFSMWTAATGGTFNGDGTLTPAETFAGSGTLELTATTTGS